MMDIWTFTTDYSAVDDVVKMNGRLCFVSFDPTPSLSPWWRCKWRI